MPDSQAALIISWTGTLHLHSAQVHQAFAAQWGSLSLAIGLDKRVVLLDVLGRMEVWLAHQGRTGLTPDDRVILLPRFQRLARDAGSVAALSQDFVGELEHR